MCLSQKSYEARQTYIQLLPASTDRRSKKKTDRRCFKRTLPEGEKTIFCIQCKTRWNTTLKRCTKTKRTTFIAPPCASQKTGEFRPRSSLRTNRKEAIFFVCYHNRWAIVTPTVYEETTRNRCINAQTDKQMEHGSSNSNC